MTENNQIRFNVFHFETGQIITDLEVTVDHAGNLVSDEKLLSLLIDLIKGLNRNGYNFTLWKEGEDR